MALWPRPTRRTLRRFYSTGKGVLQNLRARIRFRLRPHPGDVAVVQGVAVELGPHLSPRMKEQIVDGRYEKAELALLGRHLRPDDVVLELGAGIGLLSAFCALKLGSDRVHAFEANPELERRIRRTYDLTGVSPSLTMCALGERRGTTELYLEREFWSSSRLRRSPSARSIEVPMEPINEVLGNTGATLLIVDIEGGESELLEYLDLSLLRGLLIEFHPHVIGAGGVERLERKLREAGWSQLSSERGVRFYERPR